MKSTIVHRLMAVLFVATIALPAGAQQIDSMINLYGEKFPREKIYIQFDKPAYNTGETIWFKAYLFAGITPSQISKNLYAELIDPSGKVIQHKLMPVYEGSSAGFFDLPASYNHSTLIFRAYTTWMLNFDSAFLFSRIFRIVDKTTAPANAAAKQPAANTAASKQPATTPRQPAISTSLRFFPEGGDLVSDLESVIAFKAVDMYGLPVPVSGIIKDAAGSQVAYFESTHDGMGRFNLKPQAGKTYTAEWQDENKQTCKTPLPPVKTSGVVLQCITANNRQSFIIRRPADAPASLKNLYLLGYFNQQVIYKARLNMLENTVVSGSIPLDGIPTGILQMTLFDASWQPQAERIAFVNKDDYFFTTRLTPALKNTEKRGKNILVIDVPDTLRTNLSISITDEGISKMDPDANNIVSHLLLNSDLRGYVHNPYYYFTGNDDTLKAHLDLVMLTNGWRRYKWEDLAAGKLPTVKYPRENYLSLNATLTGLLPSQIPKNTQLNVFLETKDSSRQLFVLAMDDAGRFRQDGLVFFDTVKVFYQFNNNKNLTTKAIVNFTNGAWKGSATVKPDTAWRIPMPIDTSILNRGRYFAVEAARIKPELEKKVKTLETVTVRARQKSKQQQMDERYTSGLFSGGDAVTFDLTDDPSAMGALNIFQYLQGRVAGLQINTGAGGTQLSWRQATPALFLNEMPVDVSAIESLPVTDIAYVKAFRPPFFGAAGGGSGGAIAIYTKKGADAKPNTSDVSGLEKVMLPGYSATKQFYSPDYSKESPLNDVPDIRTTLYWAPYILTDKNSRKITLHFYNNDISKRLRVVLEGMNEYGQLTRVEKLID